MDDRMKIRKIKGVWKWACPTSIMTTGRLIWIPVPKNTHAAAVHEVNMHIWSNHAS